MDRAQPRDPLMFKRLVWIDPALTHVPRAPEK